MCADVAEENDHVSANSAADRLNRFRFSTSRLELRHRPTSQHSSRSRLPHCARYNGDGERPLVLSNRSGQPAKVLVPTCRRRTFGTKRRADCARDGRLDTIATCADAEAVGGPSQRPSVRQRGRKALCRVPGMEPPCRIRGRGAPIVSGIAAAAQLLSLRSGLWGLCSG